MYPKSGTMMLEYAVDFAEKKPKVFRTKKPAKARSAKTKTTKARK